MCERCTFAFLPYSLSEYGKDVKKRCYLPKKRLGGLHIMPIGLEMKKSSDLIGREQEPNLSTFTLMPKVQGKRPPKYLHGSTFRYFWWQELGTSRMEIQTLAKRLNIL